MRDRRPAAEADDRRPRSVFGRADLPNSRHDAQVAVRDGKVAEMVG